MRLYFLIILLFAGLSAFSQKTKSPAPVKSDSVKTRTLIVLTLTKEDYAEMLQWIQSSAKHSGGECQDFTDFLKTNTKIIQDTTRKK